MDVNVTLDAFARTGEQVTPADLQVDRHVLAVHDRVDGALVGVDAVVDPLLRIELEAENVAEVVRSGMDITTTEYGSDVPGHDCMLARDRPSQCPDVRHEAARRRTPRDRIRRRGDPRPACVRSHAGGLGAHRRDRLGAVHHPRHVPHAGARSSPGNRARSPQATAPATGTGSIWWAPRALAWWIGVLFMIGSTCFALGALPGYLDAVGVDADNLTFFVGSLFFTSAALLQYVEVVRTPETFGLPASGARRTALWQPHRIDWWAIDRAAGRHVVLQPQHRFRVLRRARHRAVQPVDLAPDALGSICFLVASGLAWAEVAHGLFRRAVDCRAGSRFLNLMGSVAFGVSAVAAQLTPDSGEPRNVELVNLGTFVGALCFLVGAALLLPEHAQTE